MFNLCKYRVREAGNGGMLLRAHTGRILELQVKEGGKIQPGAYPVKSILVDSYQDRIIINGMNNTTLAVLSGTEGTKLLTDGDIIDIVDPNPHNTAVQQKLEDDQETAQKIADNNSFI